MIEVYRLSSQNLLQVEEHLLRLSLEDRYLRFFSAVSDEFIRRYVRQVMNLDSSLGFGANDENRNLIAFAHVAIVQDGSCELAFSIDDKFRSKGLARQLMKTCIDECRARNVTKLCMSCLRQNKKMQALAKSFGLNMTITYDQSYAELGTTQ